MSSVDTSIIMSEKGQDSVPTDDSKENNDTQIDSNKENSAKTTAREENSRPKPNRVLPEIKVESVIPKRRQDLLKWDGWGYKDSKFEFKNNTISFTSNRYLIGEKVLPYFAEWVIGTFKTDLSRQRTPPAEPTSYPPSRLPADVAAALRAVAALSLDGADRALRAHGQTLRDVATARSNSFQRIPDAVVWPACHEHVQRIVDLATRHKLVLLPFGGGTSVSGSVACPGPVERRPIISVDTSQMNSILWLDGEQLLACVEAGIVGQDLERELRARGFTTGHEPDSYEFSTLGGWVATRASGMKKNTYGNIEEMVVHARMVTPRGVLQRGCRVPRLSCGPDLDRAMLGSEGSLGIITEVVLKVRPLPAITHYGSLLFPDFESGCAFMREVARRRLQPASVRLMDNEQFRFGQALRPAVSWAAALLESVKRAYVTRVRGYRLDRACVTTLLFEGEAGAVAAHEKALNALAAQFGGLPAGSTNGERGYTLTFVIAYIRDLALTYDIVAESFETSVPWDRTLALCRNVKRRLADECCRHGIQHFLSSCRVTQTYDAGCCVYFYFAFNSASLDDPVAIYEEIEENARDEIILNGGSISHHHGVGKLRKKWYTQTVSEPGMQLLIATKKTLDPDNIFATGNMAFEEGEDPTPKAKSKL